MTSISAGPESKTPQSSPGAVAGSEEARPPVEPASDKLLAEEAQSALERERWLRKQFEQEHQVLLAMMRLLISGVGTEGRLMRFWRWLIDDYRSERRMLEAPPSPSEGERRLVSRIVAWFRRGGVEPASNGDTTFSGSA
jgi:hypothetical protein